MTVFASGAAGSFLPLVVFGASGPKAGSLKEFAALIVDLPLEGGAFVS